MDENYLKGMKFGLGFVIIIGLVFGLVWASGWHTADEILGGTFLGSYTFTGNLDLSGTNVTGLSNEVGDYVLLEVNNGTNITSNSRYVLDNPFGNSTPVIVQVEVFHNNRWANPGFIYEVGGYGVIASYVEGEGIIVQTGSSRIVTDSSSHSGGGHAATSNTNLAPARVHVWKIN